MLTAEEILFLEVIKPHIAEILTNDNEGRPNDYTHYNTMLPLSKDSDEKYIPFFEDKVMLTNYQDREFFVWFYATEWEGIRIKNAQFIGKGPYKTVILRDDQLATVF